MNHALLKLDPETAAQLEFAIKLAQRAFRDNGLSPTAGLVDIEHFATECKEGNAGANGAERGVGDQTPTYVAGDDHRLLTQVQAGRLAGRHPRTIRNYLDKGELGFVTVRGRRQIPRHELDRFMETK